MNRLHCCLVLLLLLMLGRHGVSLADPVPMPDLPHRVLTAAHDVWPPYVMEDGQSGFVVELVAEAFASQGYRLQLMVMPFARAMTRVRRGQMDIIPSTWLTPSRQRYLMYSDQYLVNEIVVVSHAKRPVDYSGHGSLKGKLVGTVRGYSYSQNFDDIAQFHPLAISNAADNFRRILLGRIDVTVEDRFSARHIIQTQQLGLQHFYFAEQPFSRMSLHVSTSRYHPTARELIEAFNRGLVRLKQNGQYVRLYNRYFHKPVGDAH